MFERKNGKGGRQTQQFMLQIHAEIRQFRDITKIQGGVTTFPQSNLRDDFALVDGLELV